MPFSYSEHDAWIINRVEKLAPSRVVDVGPGAGKYVDLLRKPGQHWTGLEIFPRYILDYGLQYKYDRIVVDDVRKSWDVLVKADLVIFGDVLEHLTKAEAYGVLEQIPGSVAVLASGPIVDFPQGEWEGNDHEAHLWYPKTVDWVDMIGAEDWVEGEWTGAFYRPSHFAS